MKLKVEIKSKDWMQLAVFILIAYLIFSGKAETAVKLMSLWRAK